ncbi:hypothetical protein FSC37_13610 [Piscinibacter aquaticus]|uniref:Uncharacterized protein n=1 Tax=Piscinibacter aquaticus TaxID=392597 RepID=A0A5C6U177_9BURK|nr:hypothetical protein FSC37_13610 [Piscinibacter aquaticus]
MKILVLASGAAAVCGDEERWLLLNASPRLAGHPVIEAAAAQGAHCRAGDAGCARRAAGQPRALAAGPVAGAVCDAERLRGAHRPHAEQRVRRLRP